MKPVRVLLADDHLVVLEGLRRILDRPELEIVGAVADGRDLLQAVSELNPDLILADISMPSIGGIEALRQIRRMDGDLKFIFLTMHSEVPYAVEALASGASGYVLKNSAGTELIRAIQEVLKGRTYVAEAIREAVLGALEAGSKKAWRSIDLLTPRQREVLQLLAQGLHSKEIAAKLNVSPKTVEFHKQQMKQILGVQTVAELAVYAARHGITA